MWATARIMTTQCLRRRITGLRRVGYVVLDLEERLNNSKRVEEYVVASKTRAYGSFALYKIDRTYHWME